MRSMDLWPESAAVTEWSKKRLSMLTQSRRICRNYNRKHNSSKKNSRMSTTESPVRWWRWRIFKMKRRKNWMRFKYNMKTNKLIWRKNLTSKTRSVTNFKPKLSPFSNNKITAWTKWASSTVNDTTSINASMTSIEKFKKYKRETKTKNTTIKQKRMNLTSLNSQKTNLKTKNSKSKTESTNSTNSLLKQQSDWKKPKKKKMNLIEKKKKRKNKNKESRKSSNENRKRNSKLKFHLLNPNRNSKNTLSKKKMLLNIVKNLKKKKNSSPKN